MADSDEEKAKLFKRLYGASLHTVMERMRVHGFWPTGVGLPADPPDEAKERAQVQAELTSLRATYGAKVDVEKALREERVRRWQASKARRANARAALLEKLKQRREAYAALKAGTVVHAGEGVSAGLSFAGADAQKLLGLGLPVIGTAAELATALGVSLPKLRWLTYHRRAAALVHYHRYGIPKKTGGLRNISAPKPALAKAQRWVLQQLLSRLPVSAQAHGFVKGRGTVSNASAHLGRPVVVNLDVKDFFPSITFARVRGLFGKLGYGGQVATLLALLCTEPPRVATALDGKKLFVALGDRRLPQGACTSPAITNLLCMRLDKRLSGLARRHGAGYTRYADDLTFSLPSPEATGKVLKSARSILRSEGFDEHPEKTRVMRKGRRQEVTGLTVNRKLSIPRDELRQLRAIVHNVGKHGLESQNRNNHPHFESYLRGRIAYVHMVEPAKAAALRAKLDAALDRGA